ncbi:hypothetical protein [Microlunatus speluncae]|uniref:hypothetical protein n=1 Tax=Microlunatus speluncae TaxID=2594267 RepID=UPI0012663603|nr:hypothetical protein [Microlunatus speluncae]
MTTTLHPDHATILAAVRQAADLIDTAHYAMVGTPMPGPTVAAIGAELEHAAVGLAAHCDQLVRALALAGHGGPAVGCNPLAVAEHLRAAERNARYAAAWIGEANKSAHHGQPPGLAA